MKHRDVFTLTHFIKWLKTKPANATYCYTATHDCLNAQYVRERLGLSPDDFLSCGSKTITFRRGGGAYTELKLPHAFDRLAQGGLPGQWERTSDYTFGGALARARTWQKHLRNRKEQSK